MRQPTGDRDIDLRALRLVLDIEYENAVGKITARRITVHRLVMVAAGRNRFNCTHVVAFCHLRRAPRIFWVGGIVAAIDPETGEIVGDLAAWATAALKEGGSEA